VLTRTRRIKHDVRARPCPEVCLQVLEDARATPIRVRLAKAMPTLPPFADKKRVGYRWGRRADQSGLPRSESACRRDRAPFPDRRAVGGSQPNRGCEADEFPES